MKTVGNLSQFLVTGKFGTKKQIGKEPVFVGMIKKAINK
jgi:hypothetical protein